MTMTEAQVKSVLNYGGSAQISQLGLSLLLTRLKGVYKANPAPPVLARCTSELNTFLSKYGEIMRKDYDWMINL